MILEKGGKVLVVYRRLYDGDEPRYFTGIVDGYEAGIVRATGHSWMKDPFAAAMIEKPEPRTKIFSIASGTLIVYQLPESVELAKLRFESQSDGGLWLKDGAAFRMNLTERPHSRAAAKGR